MAIIMNKKIKLLHVIWVVLFIYLILQYLDLDLSARANKQAKETYDMLYVINLDRSPERYDDVRKQLDKYNLKHIKFSAIDGYKIKLQNLANNLEISGLQIGSLPKKLLNDKYKLKCSEATTVTLTSLKNLTPGEIGCLCSHLEVWNDVVKNQYSTAVILEDDVILSDNFDEKLRKLIVGAPQDYDILYLGLRFGSFAKQFVLFNDEVFKINVKNANDTTHGYMINDKSAVKLLELARNVNAPIDLYLSSLVGEINTYMAKELIVKENPKMSSEISLMGRDH